MPGETSLHERTELRVAGAMANRFLHLPHLAKAWMAELWRVGYYLGGRKEAGEVSFPPEQTGRGFALPLRLENGQTLLLVPGAYREDPRGDGRTFLRTEVQGVVPRTDRAQLAALCVLEGSELPKNRDSRLKRLEKIRAYLRGDGDELRPEEEKLVYFVCLLLWSYRPDISVPSTDGIELFVATCDRVAKVAESSRQLSDFLEFGEPGSDTRPDVEDAQMDVYAAELSRIAGFSQIEVAEKLGLPVSEAQRDKRAHSTAAHRIKRGVDLFVRALGGREKWDRYAGLRLERFRQQR